MFIEIVIFSLDKAYFKNYFIIFSGLSRNVNSSKNPIRPLSANRCSTTNKTDSKAEADAVMKALVQENKEAELFSKRPLPKKPEVFTS